MSNANPDLYVGREQTLVKHTILQHYLQRFAHIIGSWCDVITYVDCFSGPWNVRSDALRDSSFYLALQELRTARDTHAKHGRSIHIRCMFLERDPESFAKLRAFANSVTDAEVKARNAKFEDSIAEIMAFVEEGGTGSFPFVFIDPTGWTGFAMDKIGPLLQLEPSEVLINFMTGHIRRFIDAPNDVAQEGFEQLFGSDVFRQRIAGLDRQDREDELVEAYIDMVKCTGDYRYVCPAIVLHPKFNRTHFHLIYATRSPKGVEVFKSVEKKAMVVMEKDRAAVQQRKRVAKSGQQELSFAVEAMHDSHHYDSLRDRYLEKAKLKVLELLRSRGQVPFDDLWTETLSEPLVWESDLKDWIRQWAKEGTVQVEGMGPRDRVPKREANHRVVFRGQGV